MKSRSFTHLVRVPYAHTDQMGFVYYANYFVYFEMARSEMLRTAGAPYTELEKKGVLLPVVKAFCEYLKPGHYDDALTVLSRCTQISGPRLRIEYEITRGPDTLARGYTEHVCMCREGKILRSVPELNRLLDEES